MTRWLRLVTLLLAGWASTGAQAELACPPAVLPAASAQPSDTDPAAAPDRGFLWRITRDGRHAYLYGTVHLGRPEWARLGPLTKKALDESDTVVVEVDLHDPDTQRRLAQAMAAAKPQALPAALQERLAQKMRALCLEPAQLAHLSPEMQLVMMSVQTARSAGLDVAHGIDSLITRQAYSARQRVVALETPEAQLALLHTKTEAETIAYVESSLAEMSNERVMRTVRHVARIWAESDHAELARHKAWCECDDTEIDRQSMKRLLEERHPAMVERIDALHAQGHRVFAAVGSLHMVGPQGLPALFAQRGYSVSVVKFSR